MKYYVDIELRARTRLVGRKRVGPYRWRWLAFFSAWRNSKTGDKVQMTAHVRAEPV